MRHEDETLSCYGPEDDFLLLPEEREMADFWRQERRNEQFITANRAAYRRSLTSVSDPDDPYSAES